jgi:serine/threonine-protein kinase HipA
VAGEGRNPTKSHILSVADKASIAKTRTEQMFAQVRAAVDRWPQFGKEAEVSERRISEIDHLLNKRGA